MVKCIIREKSIKFANEIIDTAFSMSSIGIIHTLTVTNSVAKKESLLRLMLLRMPHSATLFHHYPTEGNHLIRCADHHSQTTTGQYSLKRATTIWNLR